MNVYAVEYHYDPAATDLMDEVRPRHRAFLGELRDAGTNIASGPWLGEAPGALLLMRADSLEALEALLDHDPFHEAGVIQRRDIRQWNPVIATF